MMKNLFLLVLFIWVSLSYAKTPVAAETMDDSSTYKMEKPVHEQEAKRSVAGGKIKKRQAPEKVEETKEGSDSEVRYWQFQE